MLFGTNYKNKIIITSANLTPIGPQDKGPLGITAQRSLGAPIEAITCDLDVELRKP